MAALSKDSKIPVVAIGGPTATGKTALAVALAQRFDGEVISADSMQLYRGLDVGTAKVTAQEAAGVPHHLIDILEPETPFSVADYVSAARQCIEGIAERGRLPLVAGGTGLYITSLLEGMSFAPEKTDPAIRAELEARAEAGQGLDLWEELRRVDPSYAETVHPNNMPRVIRALELYRATGRRMSEQRRAAVAIQPPYRSLCLCLAYRDRSLLYRKIDQRVDCMVENGILEEARMVWENRDAYRTAAQAIGYKEFFPYFEGQSDLEACVQHLKQASRNYAKRQLTWFRHQGQAVWLYVDDETGTVQERAEKMVNEFLCQA